MLGYTWPRLVDPVPRGNISNAVGDAPIRSHALCVCLTPSAPAFGWDHHCGVPVCAEGRSFQGQCWSFWPPVPGLISPQHKDCAGKGLHSTPRLLSSCPAHPQAAPGVW